MKQVIDKGLENRERALAQQRLGRADDIHVRDPEDVDRVGAVAVDEFLIDRIRSGVTHGIILMRDQSLLLPVQLHGVAEDAERSAGP